MFRKIFFAILILLIPLTILIYRNTQDPSINDVYSSTSNWSPKIDKVYVIEKILDDWVVFFKSESLLHVSKLEKNWLGNWRVVDFHNKEGTIGVILIEESNNFGVIWGATEVTNGTSIDKSIYYYGMISNPEVEEVILELEDKRVNLDLIEGIEERFFLTSNQSKDTLPFSIKAIINGKEVLIK